MESNHLEKKIEELEAQVKNLERDLIHDHLTTLKTRAFFEEETKMYLDVISATVSHSRKQWFGFTNLSLLFIDIDYFKKINDTFGHDVGDQVLRTVAHTIQTNVREGDTVARWGGEEIIVSLIGATERDAMEKAEQIRQSILTLTFEQNQNIQITVSIGVAATSKNILLNELVKHADAALYKAKELGRNMVVCWSQCEVK